MNPGQRPLIWRSSLSEQPVSGVTCRRVDRTHLTEAPWTCNFLLKTTRKTGLLITGNCDSNRVEPPGISYGLSLPGDVGTSIHSHHHWPGKGSAGPDSPINQTGAEFPQISISQVWVIFLPPSRLVPQPVLPRNYGSHHSIRPSALYSFSKSFWRKTLFPTLSHPS